MSEDARPVAARAAALRAAFDGGFAVARPADPPRGEELLAIRLGDAPYALRLMEIAGLHPERPVTPLPGGTPALRGIAGFRGQIVPVYDLAALLGEPPAETVRWLAMAAAAPVAFAVATVDGHLRLAPEAIVAGDDEEPALRHVRAVALAADATRPIVDLASVLAQLRRTADAVPAEG